MTLFKSKEPGTKNQEQRTRKQDGEKKKSGMPTYKNPPPPPEMQIGGVIPGNKINKHVLFPKIDTEWKFETFHTNDEMRDFINENKINPRFLYPTSTGRVVVWWVDVTLK